MKDLLGQLSLEDAVLIKSAQLWLLLGRAKEALAELEGLTPAARETAWAKAVFRYAIHQAAAVSEAGLPT